jgi:hypothetical protein
LFLLCVQIAHVLLLLLLLCQGLSRLSQTAGGSSSNLSASVMPAFVVEALQDAPSSSSSSRQQQQQQGPRAANVGELVACLQQLDALEDAKVYLLLQARAGIRRMVLEVRLNNKNKIFV